jgi:conjugal transfer pilus assembly protein TraE
MKQGFKDIKLGNLTFQRNALAGLASVLLIIALLQTIFLFLKNEKIIILPPETKQSFWVEGNKFSPIYLEEQAIFFAHLLLDVSASNILSQGEILLRYTDSSAHEILKTRLFREEARLKRDNVSMKFEMVECEVFPNQLMLELSGDLHAYVAHKKISTHRETYRVQFTSKSGRLFLKSFEVIKSDNKDLVHLLAEEDAFSEDLSAHENQPDTESKKSQSQSFLVSSVKEEPAPLNKPTVEAISEDPKSKEENGISSSATVQTVPQTDTQQFIQENSHA